jgi:hypothetical protein
MDIVDIGFIGAPGDEKNEEESPDKVHSIYAYSFKY